MHSNIRKDDIPSTIFRLHILVSLFIHLLQHQAELHSACCILFAGMQDTEHFQFFFIESDASEHQSIAF